MYRIFADLIHFDSFCPDYFIMNHNTVQLKLRLITIINSFI